MKWFIGIAVTLVGIVIAWYFYSQSQSTSSGIQAELDDLESQQATSGLGLTVAGMGVAGQLVSSIGNALGAGGSGNSSVDDLGDSDDYSTDMSSFDDDDDDS